MIIYCPFCGNKIKIFSKESPYTYMWTGGNLDMINIRCLNCKKDFNIRESDYTEEFSCDDSFPSD